MADDNKTNAITFLKMSAGGEISEAYSKFVGKGFKHHNQFFEGSADSLQAGMQENARANPNKVFEVKRAIVEGDFVVTHSHVRQTPDALGAAVVHIFRFENGK